MIQRIFSKLTQQQKFFTFLFFVIFLVVFCVSLWDLILPLLLAFILAYILMPLVDRLTLLLNYRLLAIFVIYLSFLIFFIFGFQFLFPPIVSEFNELTSNIPQYYSNFQEWLTVFVTDIEKQYPYVKNSELLLNIQTNIQPFIMTTLQRIPNLFLSTFSIITLSLFVPLMMFFFLYQGHDYARSFFKFIPNRYFELFVKLFYSAGRQISAYIRGIFIESIIIGLLTVGMLLSLKSDYAVLLGTIAGIANIIPYVGPLLAAVPAVVIFYLKMSSIKAALIIILGFVAVQVIDNIILKPVIFSRSVNLHPLIVFLGLIVGGMLGDMWGLILAVPLMGSIKVSSEIVLREIDFRLSLKR